MHSRHSVWANVKRALCDWAEVASHLASSENAATHVHSFRVKEWDVCMAN